jgi:predicted N-formylglutamate amidohydrolase
MRNGLKSFPSALLEPDEPAAFELARGDGQSPFVIICDHAGLRVPRALGNLGLSEADLTSHVAWDIGIQPVASRLASVLGAFVIFQTYSRLVIDCNRPLTAADSIVTRTAGIDVPGNQNLSAAAR